MSAAPYRTATELLAELAALREREADIVQELLRRFGLDPDTAPDTAPDTTEHTPDP